MCTVTNFIEEHGDIWLTPLFWDCECEDDYIHPASEPICYRCHFEREESPDARVPEVLKYADLLPKPLVDIVEEAFAVANPEYSSIPF
jgi:hypothetical protein